ncbi:MAG TPA: DUF3365 domain-containing protein [Planctomycetaceae bacterium]|nr:DUF3365 domain-containing protein [Planctomycetaceae bacterium]
MMKRAGVLLAMFLTTAWLTSAVSQEPARDSETPRPVARHSVEEAQRLAAALHSSMHATIQVVHHRYYREDQGLPIPAAVLKDVFTDIEDEQGIKLRWLVVEGQAMNVDHKPQGKFENDAVAALKTGKLEFDAVENGVYRRAGAITLSSDCLKCHVPDRKNTKNRTAGLLISVPVKAD